MPELPWKPRRPTVVVLGLLSIWPLMYLGLFFSMFAFSFWWDNQQGDPAPDAFKYIFPVHCGTMLVTFGLIGVYIFHLFRTDRIAADKKALWAVVLFLGNMMAIPFYWYLYMWREPSGSSSHTGDDPMAGAV